MSTTVQTPAHATEHAIEALKELLKSGDPAIRLEAAKAILNHYR